MKLILLERVGKLGRTGDVVTVRDGHARNHLLPKRMALPATKANIAHFESQRAEIEARNLRRRAHAEDEAAALDGKVFVSLQQAGESGQLYGSVNAREISRLLESQGVSLAHNRILLPTPIKTLGLHAVAVELHGEISVDIHVNVARSEEEAERQLHAARPPAPEAEAEAEAAETSPPNGEESEASAPVEAAEPDEPPPTAASDSSPPDAPAASSQEETSAA